MKKRFLLAALGACGLLVVPAQAEVEYFLGVGVGADLSDVRFSQLTQFTPEPNGSWTGRIVRQNSDSRLGAVKLSGSARAYYLKDRVFIDHSIDFQHSLDDIGSGSFAGGSADGLKWNLGALKQAGLESRVGYTPMQWRGSDAKKSLYLSLALHKAFADYDVSAANVPYSDTADGRLRTLGLGIELTKKNRVLLFELKRTDGFIETKVDTSRMPAINQLYHSFSLDFWRFGVHYRHRFGN